MSFLHPAAFAGLASLLVLILLSLWRQRPATVIVPSVRLWERIPDRLPPVRALRRPSASLSLFLQMIVATSLVLALAGPGIVRMKPAPRRMAVVVDSSAYMAPRMDEIKRELAKLDESDEITVIDTAMLRREGDKYFISSDKVFDPSPALDLAASEAKHVVYVSDRRPSWSPPVGVKLHLALVGGPLDNAGVVHAAVENGKLFLRLSRAAEVEVTIGNAVIKRPPAISHLVEVPEGATRMTASLAPDAFPADDRVEFERAEGRIEVGFAGRPDASILAAIESNPRARVVRGGSPRLLIRIGSAASKGGASVVVDVDPVEGVGHWGSPAGVAAHGHPLMRGVESDDLRFVQVGAVSGPTEEILISHGKGEPVAAIRRPGEIVLAARWASTGWPTRPSFPIFWANVIEYAASGVGEWRAKGLLDEAASRPGLDGRPFDPSALEARPMAPHRSDLTAGSVALAALLLGLLWVVELRRSGE